MLSALSHQLRKFDGVSVTDTQPALKVKYLTIQIHAKDVKIGEYTASVAVTSIVFGYGSAKATASQNTFTKSDRAKINAASI